ncbi:MAG TPA: DUF11 domain-containing protein [Thermodesulfobacteriota bacterium]|nr:DUF11 domain-containing protein [Thermodesulfobacteriota bacterium]
MRTLGFFSRSFVFSVLFVVSFLSLAGGALAQTEGNSSAYGVFAELDLLPLIGPAVSIDLGPVAPSAGSAPPDYTDSDTVLSASLSSGLVGSILSTGLLSTEASSDIGNDTTSSSSTVDGLNLSIVGLLPLLTIGADTVATTAEVTGSCADETLTATGTTTIENAGAGGTLGLGLTIDSSPTPNFELINLLGIRVVLNEQIITGDGVNSRGITVNAIRIDLTDTVLSLIGALSGDIVIAQSQAEVVCNEVEGSSDLSMVKTSSPNPVVVNNTLTYTLTVTNDGPDDATGVTVTDVLPASFTIGTITPSQGTCNPLVGTTLTCSLGTITNGGNATVTIEATPTQTGVIANTAVVSGDQPDPDPTDNSSTESTTVEGSGGEPTDADLSISKTSSPNPVIVNQDLTYSIAVSNLGPDPVTDAEVVDTLPAGVTFGSANPGQGTCNEAAGVVTCAIGAMNPGQTVVITMTVTPTAIGDAVNSVTVGSSLNDPNTANNSDTETTAVEAEPESADISVTKTGSPNPATVDQELTYTVTVSNSGPDVAANVVVTDTLPAGAIFISANPEQGSCEHAGGVVTCDLQNIAGGGDVVTTIIIIPTIPGVASNNVTVTSDVDDPDPGDNSDEENTDVNPAPPGPTPSDPPSEPTESPFPPPGGPGEATAVPTLSGWAMMILPMLLMIAAVYLLRRQERGRRSRGM